MKKILLVMLLACGATALANNTDPIQEKKNAATAHSTKIAAKAEKASAAVVKHEAVKEENTHIVADNSRYGLGAYIVEFINRNNIKIMRKLLID
jgi:hypothetical protein